MDEYFHSGIDSLVEIRYIAYKGGLSVNNLLW